jgi:hypothetical protein
MPARPAAATVIRDMRKLLTPHIRAIGRPAGPAQDDAVDPASVEGTPAALKNDLIQLVGQDQVLHRVSDLVRCTNGLLDDVKNYLDDEHRARLEEITLLDAIAWCDSLLPRLTISERVERAAVHPTCSTAYLGLTKTLERLAARTSRSSSCWRS